MEQSQAISSRRESGSMALLKRRYRPQKRMRMKSSVLDEQIGVTTTPVQETPVQETPVQETPVQKQTNDIFLDPALVAITTDQQTTKKMLAPWRIGLALTLPSLAVVSLVVLLTRDAPSTHDVSVTYPISKDRVAFATPSKPVLTTPDAMTPEKHDNNLLHEENEALRVRVALLEAETLSLNEELLALVLGTLNETGPKTVKPTIIDLTNIPLERLALSDTDSQLAKGAREDVDYESDIQSAQIAYLDELSSPLASDGEQRGTIENRNIRKVVLDAFGQLPDKDELYLDQSGNPAGSAFGYLNSRGDLIEGTAVDNIYLEGVDVGGQGGE